MSNGGAMVDLTDVGLADAAAVHHNLSTPALFEEAIRRGEGRASYGGSLVARTGEYTACRCGSSASAPGPACSLAPCSGTTGPRGKQRLSGPVSPSSPPPASTPSPRSTGRAARP